MNKTLLVVIVASATILGLSILVHMFGSPEHKQRLRGGLMTFAVEAVLDLLSYLTRAEITHSLPRSGLA